MFFVFLRVLTQWWSHSENSPVLLCFSNILPHDPSDRAGRIKVRIIDAAEIQSCKMGFIFKPEPGLSPKSQAQTWLQPDI